MDSNLYGLRNTMVSNVFMPANLPFSPVSEAESIYQSEHVKLL